MPALLPAIFAFAHLSIAARAAVPARRTSRNKDATTPPVAGPGLAATGCTVCGSPEPHTSDTELLTVPEAARHVRLPVSSVYEMIREGRLEALRFSPRRTRVPLRALLGGAA